MIATEKKVSTILADEASFHKIQNVTGHLGVVYAGIGPDYPSVVKKARKDAIKYEQIYRDKIPSFILAKSLAELMQEYTQRGGIRPFGISLLVAGVDHEGPKLY